jgi:hypothetical protein
VCLYHCTMPSFPNLFVCVPYLTKCGIDNILVYVQEVHTVRILTTFNYHSKVLLQLHSVSMNKAGQFINLYRLNDIYICRKQVPELAECHIYMMRNTCYLWECSQFGLGFETKTDPPRSCQRFVCLL